MIAALVRISNKYGMDENFVLAGGGNTSFKDTNYLHIKGSGIPLADITSDGFVKMNRNALNEMFSKTYSIDNKIREREVLTELMNSRTAGEDGKRPSVETLLHNLFDYAYVVHTHPVLVNGLACSINGKTEAARLFPDAIWIDLTEPGYTLAITVKREMDSYMKIYGRRADIVILQNHGVFVAGNTAGEIDNKYNQLIGKLKTDIKLKPDFSEIDFNREHIGLLTSTIRMLTGCGTTRFKVNTDIRRFVDSESAFVPLSSIYTPDHMVYYKKAPLFIKQVSDIEEQFSLIERKIKQYENQNGYLPGIIAIEKLGFFSIAENIEKAIIKEQLFLDTVKIAVYSENFGGGLFMNDTIINFIENWEAESYRQSVKERM